MSINIKIRKGLDIKLKGAADRVYANTPNAVLYAIKPIDFHLLFPKMTLTKA